MPQVDDEVVSIPKANNPNSTSSPAKATSNEGPPTPAICSTQKFPHSQSHFQIDKSNLYSIMTPYQAKTPTTTDSTASSFKNRDTTSSHKRGRRKTRWRLRFHHQALPPEYLTHYQAALRREENATSADRASVIVECTTPPPTTITETSTKITDATISAVAATIPSPSDLPFMGEMTLDAQKPRRGRKPKKADICHLARSYLIQQQSAVVPPTPQEPPQQNEPLNLCIRDNVKREVPTSVPSVAGYFYWPSARVLVHPVALQARLLGNVETTPQGGGNNSSQQASSSSTSDSTVASAATSIVRKTIQLQSRPAETNTVSLPPSSSLESSMCKFKFTAGIRPSLQERRVLKVAGSGATPGIRTTTETAASTDDNQRRRRRTRKSLARERLEQTFREQGFLIQTQQTEAAGGDATFCKFRQLRKFTRYLFRSWRDHLPANLRDQATNQNPANAPP